MNNENRIFAKNRDDFLKQINTFHIENNHLQAQVLSDGVILPLKCNKNYPKEKNAYIGGVCDKNLNFIAGSAINQSRFSCSQSYFVDSCDIKVYKDTVVFGGIFYNHFGIMLLLSLTRFWWLVKNKDTKYKIIFLTEQDYSQNSHNNDTQNYCDTDAQKYITSLMELFEIDEDQYWILNEPTRFAKIIIPDEVLSSINGKINSLFITPFHFLRDKILAQNSTSSAKKIYLSRRNYRPGERNYGINEEWYEDFYKKRGYTIIHPQEFPLRKQIQIIASADKIVSTYGTLSHLISLFAKPMAMQVMLLRSEIIDEWFSGEASILEMLDLDWYIVEATKNPYPATHDFGFFLYYPTNYFRQFLDSTKTTYDIQEFESSLSNEQIKQYIICWLECYSIPWNFKRLSRPELFPVLQSLYYSITGIKLDTKDYI